MEDYLRFEPSKKEIYDEGLEDKYYLFLNNKILISDDGEYRLPDRKYVDIIKDDISWIDCIGAYNKNNCYTGSLYRNQKFKNYRLIDLREYVEKTDDENQLLVSARAYMLKNHIEHNRKCGVCGSETRSLNHRQDRALKCINCGHEVWPTNSSAVIAAIVKDGKLLMGHNHSFPKGRYSILAGFVEMGETFEECLEREIYEETSIKIKNIKYFGSQPWPFPNSTMIGFTAEYAGGEIKVDELELSHADWFTVDQVKEMYFESRSIASSLIKWFIEEYE